MTTVRIEQRGQIRYVKCESKTDAEWLILSLFYAYGADSIKAEIL